MILLSVHRVSSWSLFQLLITLPKIRHHVTNFSILPTLCDTVFSEIRDCSLVPSLLCWHCFRVFYHGVQRPLLAEKTQCGGQASNHIHL